MNVRKQLDSHLRTESAHPYKSACDMCHANGNAVTLGGNIVINVIHSDEGCGRYTALATSNHRGHVWVGNIEVLPVRHWTAAEVDDNEAHLRWLAQRDDL
jgi:hypothetical protein